MNKLQTLRFIKGGENDINIMSRELGLDDNIVSQIVKDYTRCSIGWSLNSERGRTREGSICEGPVCVKKSGNRGSIPPVHIVRISRE